MRALSCSWCDSIADFRVDTDGWIDIACIEHVREYFASNAIHPHSWDRLVSGSRDRSIA